MKWILLLSTGLWAADGTELLRKVEEKLRQAGRLHLASVSEREFVGENNRSWARSREVLARDGEGRLRYEVRDTSGSFVVVTDGAMLWRAVPDTREFTREAVTGDPLATKGGGPLGEMALRRAKLGFDYVGKRLLDRLQRAEITGRERVEVEGRTVECAVVRADYTPQERAVGVESWVKTYWIEESRLVVWKEEAVVRGRQFPDRPYEETMSRHFTRYMAATVDEPVDAALFRYVAPQSFREVDRLERAFPRPAKQMVGKAAPDVKLPVLGGATLGLDALRGKVVILDFWATWCEPCRRQMPSIAKLHRELAGQDAVVLGVNDDESPEKARAYIAEQKLDWTHLYDGPAGQARKAFEVTAIPTIIVLDREGKIAAYETGLAESSEKTLRETLRRLGMRLLP
jgi:cytochrome c biogenesis protein CcmG, thiol:disulfide interchange protein DsbE